MMDDWIIDKLRTNTLTLTEANYVANVIVALRRASTNTDTLTAKDALIAELVGELGSLAERVQAAGVAYCFTNWGPAYKSAQAALAHAREQMPKKPPNAP